MSGAAKTDGDIHPDGLRSVDQLGRADARMQFFAMSESGTTRAFGQEDRRAGISRFELRSEVPDDVRVHYDTARNLYLYAWFVYRFHAIAEQQALASLEMALRLRLIKGKLLNAEGSIVTKLPPKVAGGQVRERVERPTLRRLLQLAAKHNYIRNDSFANRSQWAHAAAEHRVRLVQIEYMAANSLTEMVVAEEVPTPTTDELNHDWLAAFVDALPNIRNTYAHGSSMLHASVLRTFDVVSDLINQLFTSSNDAEIAASSAA
jgi:hypothetical protein